MKGKRYSIEDKIRMLREADTGRSITERCREKNHSKATFHRWKRAFQYRGGESSRRFFPRQAPFFSHLSACFSMWLGLDQSPSSDNRLSWTRSCLHRAELSAFGR